MNMRATPAVVLATATLLAGCGGGGGSDKDTADDVLVASDPATKSFEGSFTNL
jgi:predicted small secreted protein